MAEPEKNSELVFANGDVVDESNAFELSDFISETDGKDVIFFLGTIGIHSERMLKKEVKKRIRSHSLKPKVMVCLTTFGGDANAAYRIAKFLHCHYKKVELFVYNYCKSAGTLLATGANDLIMTDSAELGPLDVQLRNSEEVDELFSGLAPNQALSSLQATAYQAFHNIFSKFRNQTRISSRIAAEIACELTVGFFSPIFQQFEPIKLGEFDRSVQVALEYVRRLNEKSKNIKLNVVDQLVTGYPSHGFVIDRDEARKFFVRCLGPGRAEYLLAETLEVYTINRLFGEDEESDSTGQSYVFYLNGLDLDDDDEGDDSDDEPTDNHDNEKNVSSTDSEIDSDSSSS